MENRHADAVRKIYKEIFYSPHIGTVSQAAGFENREVPNALGSGRNAYFDRAEQLLIEVPMAVHAVMSNDFR